MFVNRHVLIFKGIVIVLKGVILAAGEGTRIKSVTYGAIPKELLPIGNIPTVRFPLEALKLAGVKNIFIVIAPQSKHGILDGLQSGQKFGVNLCYVVQERNEKSLVGLGPAILSAKAWLKEGEDFVVACGDSILCDFSSKDPLDCLKPLVKVHLTTKALATVLLHPTNSDPTRFGVVKFRELQEENGVIYGELDGLVEKPSLKVAEAYKCNGYNFIIAGYYAFKPKIFSYIEKTRPGVKNEVQITDSIAMALEDGEKVYGVVHGKKDANKFMPYAYWDVGIPEDYKEANRRLLDAHFEGIIE